MRGLADIYDRTYFAEYGAANPTYAEACAVIAETIARRFEPRTAVDWGCGAGLHLATLASLGVQAVGVDGVSVDDDLRAPGVDIVLADITRPVTAKRIPERYDLSLCIDVLEHLHEEHSAAALDNVCRGADVVILSCAPPNQGGHHHVNERPRRYWIRRMSELGWSYDRSETSTMERELRGHRECLPMTWMYHNLCVYRRYPSPGRRLAKRLRKRRALHQV